VLVFVNPLPTVGISDCGHLSGRQKTFRRHSSQEVIRSVGILQLQINPQTEIPSFPRSRESERVRTETRIPSFP
ncbi:TPA: hypothetical protein ACT36L_002105, partial [Neisseria meningitidis]